MIGRPSLSHTAVEPFPTGFMLLLLPCAGMGWGGEEGQHGCVSLKPHVDRGRFRRAQRSTRLMLGLVRDKHRLFNSRGWNKYFVTRNTKLIVTSVVQVCEKM